MTALVVAALTLVGVAGTAVVFTAEPARQAVTVSVFGLLLSVLFVVLGAPDVALSQLAVGSAVLPLMVLLTVHRIRRGHRGGDRTDDTDGARRGGSADTRGGDRGGDR